MDELTNRIQQNRNVKTDSAEKSRRIKVLETEKLLSKKNNKKA